MCKLVACEILEDREEEVEEEVAVRAVVVEVVVELMGEVVGEVVAAFSSTFCWSALAIVCTFVQQMLCLKLILSLLCYAPLVSNTPGMSCWCCSFLFLSWID